jgi:hypothetical protein
VQRALMGLVDDDAGVGGHVRLRQELAEEHPVCSRGGGVGGWGWFGFVGGWVSEWVGGEAVRRIDRHASASACPVCRALCPAATHRSCT